MRGWPISKREGAHITMDRSKVNVGLHPLKALRSFNYGVWDIEAEDWWKLQVIGCFDGLEYYHFRNVDAFLDHILQKKYASYRWFAHFGGRYDMNFIFDRIRERGNCNVEFYCSGSMVIRMRIRHGRYLAYLCDSFRLLPAALRDLTIAFNVDHKKTSYDFGNMVFGRELLEYNEQDCRGLYEVLYNFFEQTGIRSETFATHALRYWRKEFLQRSIWKPHEYVTDFIRRGLFGGHVNVFKRTAPHLMAFDVNSMYPFVMQFPVPVDYVGESRRLSESLYGFVEAVVTVPEMYIPPLPVKLEKLFFPVGTLRGVWSTEELIEAVERGARIEKIIKGYYFKCEEIFKDYVEQLYRLKKIAGEPTRTIAKYLLNSLFGKFGQHPDKRVFVTEKEAPVGAFPIIHPDGSPSGFAEYRRRSRSAYLLPHISAAITSKARLVLLSNLSDSSYYCDTDSIFTTSQMKTGTGIGEWSLVGEGEATFYQPKLYKFKGEWKAKGLNRSQSIDAYVEGDINEIIRRKSIKEALRTGSPACEDVRIEKMIGVTRPKRVWLESGLDTRAWDIKELDTKGKLRSI